jgi:DNA-binding CsgD family transcriptional regulator
VAAVAAIRHSAYLRLVARLSAADYQSMLQLLHTAGENGGPDPFPEPVLLLLRRLIPCDTASYGDFDPDRRGWRCAPRWVGEPRAPVTDAIREAFQALRHQVVHTPSDASPVLRWSDRISRRSMQRLELYWAVSRPLGSEYELTMWLARPGETVGNFAFNRFHRDFSQHDVLVLETLRPHLLQLARNARARWPQAASMLTRREREILGWVARGKSNRQIATILYLSPGTIHKHLDNIYTKLEVPNRAAAVSRAYGLS